MNAPTNPPGAVLLDFKSAKPIGLSASMPDRRICAMKQDGINGISFWNPITGEAVGRLDDNLIEGGVGSPKRLSPDGRKLACQSWPGDLRLADLGTPPKVVGAKVSDAHTFELAFSPDGTILAVACEDHTIRLWDTATFKETGVLSGHQQAVFDVAFSSDGRTLASCDRGGVVKLWCWPVRREVATLLRDGGDLNYVAFTPDGNTLLAGGWTGLVHIWRAPTLAEIDREP